MTVHFDRDGVLSGAELHSPSRLGIAHERAHNSNPQKNLVIAREFN
jgi:hypothetical protein